MRSVHTLLAALPLAMLVSAQPALQWEISLGGSGLDYCQAGQQTADGGYILSGTSFSNDGNVSGNHGTQDIWVVKLGASGGIQWQRSYGGFSHDEKGRIRQTADGGYILVGETSSNDGDVSGNHGGMDIWLAKLDSSGNIQWQKCFGGSSGELDPHVLRTADGGYAILGESWSNDGDVSGNHGEFDLWMMKLDAGGTLQWQTCLGGTESEEAAGVIECPDGSYLVCGQTESNNGDVSGNHGNEDYWVVKLSSSGSLQWQKCLGGSAVDRASSVAPTNDGGYVISGETVSSDGDVTGHHGYGDAWVVKVDDSGNIQWQRSLGGTDTDRSWMVRQRADGGYIMAGFTKSNDGDVSGFHGSVDVWIVGLDMNGGLEWQQCLGGSADEQAYGIEASLDGGYTVYGRSGSNDGDVSPGHGIEDYWFIKLSAEDVGIAEPAAMGLSITPNPATDLLTVRCTPAMLPAQLTLCDMSGRVVLEQRVPSGVGPIAIDLSGLGDSVYIVRVQAADGAQGVARVVKGQ